MSQSTKKKHVTREVTENYDFPIENQEIVQVLQGHGNNLHEVKNAIGEKYLVSMPTKFRKSIWIKRGDYCVVTPIEEGNKVRAEITSILLKDQIKYFRQNNQWPEAFAKIVDIDETPNDERDDDGEDSCSESEFDIEPNMNRVYFDDDDDEDDEEDEEDDEDDDEQGDAKRLTATKQ